MIYLTLAMQLREVLLPDLGGTDESGRQLRIARQPNVEGQPPLVHGYGREVPICRTTVGGT